MADKDWMASTWAGKAEMMGNVKAKISGHAAALGLTPAEVTAIEQLCLAFIAVYTYHAQLQAGAAGTTDWRDQAMTGQPKGDVLPDPPNITAWVAPATPIIGILTIFRQKRDQWVEADGYTRAIGEDLMIVKPEGPNVPVVIEPTLQVSAAQTGGLVGVIVSGRADSSQWVLQTRQKGQDWKDAGTFTGKSADIIITLLSPGDPEQVEFRVQLRKNNQNYGNLSQTATATVNP